MTLLGSSKFALKRETKFKAARGLGLSGIPLGLIENSMSPSLEVDISIFSAVFFHAQYEMPSAFFIKSLQLVGGEGGVAGLTIVLGVGVGFGVRVGIGDGDGVGESVGEEIGVGAGVG